MNERKIQLTASIINALKQMDDEHVKVLLVMDGKQFVGLLTIGDIQRAILRNVSTDMCIKTILDSNKEYSFLSDSKEVIKKKMMSLRAEIMPVVDSEGNLVKIYSWDDFFSENERVISNILQISIIRGILPAERPVSKALIYFAETLHFSARTS